MNIILLLAIFLVVGTASSLYAAFFAWRRNEVAGNRHFALALLMLAWWGFAYAVELSVASAESKILWARLQYLSIPLTPLILIFLAIMLGHKWARSWKWTAPLFIIPLISNLVVWLHQPLIWSDISETMIAGTMQLKYLHGAWFNVSILYIYLLYIIAAFLVFRVVYTSQRLTRSEATILLLGSITPFVVNVLYVVGLPSLQGLDLTPLSLATFGLTTAWVVFDVRPVNSMPVVYGAAFDSLPDPAMTVDTHNRVRLLNPAGVQQMVIGGFDPELVYGGSMGEVMPAHWFELLKTADEHNTVTHEVRRDRDGVVDYFDVRATPLRDRRNRFQGRLIVIRNITKRKNEQLALAQRGDALEKAVAEQTTELRRVNAGLLQAVRTKDEFLAGMSHELRTPLNAIIGTSEAIREKIYGQVPEPLDEPLDRIDQSAAHLLELITDILDVSKIEAGNLELNTEQVVLEEICTTCIKLIQVEATKKQIEIAFSVDVQQKVIEADPRRLRQILFNLLSNAIKFTPGGGQVGLQVREVIDKQMTTFTVWDTGIGIATEDRERVFDSFVQLDSRLARKYDGTGLGLALTRDLVEMHGGKIELVSKLGIGSRFMVYLPWELKEGEG